MDFLPVIIRRVSAQLRTQKSWQRKAGPSPPCAWAARATTAWEGYFKSVPDYYNAYVWYAKSLGIQGRYQEMDVAFRKASRLSGRSWDYQEFKDAQYETSGSCPLSWSLILDLRRNNSFKSQHVGTSQISDFRDALRAAKKLETTDGLLACVEASKRLCQEWPNEVFAHIWAAAIWGDWGQMLSPEKEKRMKREAVVRLMKFTANIRRGGMVQMVLWNEIYYHSREFLKQYKLGLRFEKNHSGQGQNYYGGWRLRIRLLLF